MVSNQFWYRLTFNNNVFFTNEIYSESCFHLKTLIGWMKRNFSLERDILMS